MTRPSSADEVAEVVRAARRGSTPLLVCGGRTLIDVGDIPDAPLEPLETGALDPLVAYEPADLTVTVGAGMSLSALSAVLAARDQSLPVFHPAPGAATIGGLAAFGWTGLGRRLYGRLRDRVLEVRAVTGAGSVVRGGAKVVKNVTGFDLPRLFVGSHGTLAVLTELTLKVHPPREPLWTVGREGETAATVAWARHGVEGAVVPVEAMVEVDGDRASAAVFVPGPVEDARTVLAAFGDGLEPEPGDASFDGLCADGLLAPAEGEPDVVVRVAVRGSDLAPVIAHAGPLVRGLVDAGSSVAWLAPADPGRVAELRTAAERGGGSVVLLRAPDDLRRAIGTWGSPSGGHDIMRRLKERFDPDGVLGPGRFVT